MLKITHFLYFMLCNSLNVLASLAQQSRSPPTPASIPTSSSHQAFTVLAHIRTPRLPSARRLLEYTHSQAAQVFTTILTAAADNVPIIGMRSRSERRLSRQRRDGFPSSTLAPGTYSDEFNKLLEIYKYARIAHGISPVRTRTEMRCDYATAVARSHET